MILWYKRTTIDLFIHSLFRMKVRLITYWFNEQEFIANSDTATPVTNILPSPVVARYIRLYPTEHYRFRSLRFDVIGCEANGKLNIMWLHFKCTWLCALFLFSYSRRCKLIPLFCVFIQIRIQILISTYQFIE